MVHQLPGLDHANIALTIETYQHLLPGMQADAARTFEGLVAPAAPRSARPRLVIAGAVMGAVFSLERLSTRGVLAPMATHLTWSTLMVLALPR